MSVLLEKGASMVRRAIAGTLRTVRERKRDKREWVWVVGVVGGSREALKAAEAHAREYAGEGLMRAAIYTYRLSRAELDAHLAKPIVARALKAAGIKRGRANELTEQAQRAVEDAAYYQAPLSLPDYTFAYRLRRLFKELSKDLFPLDEPLGFRLATLVVTLIGTAIMLWVIGSAFYFYVLRYLI
jgi:hypothetical protein